MTNTTFTIHEPYCPLYDAVAHCEPWNAIATAHAGLLFDKFGHAWRTKNDGGKSHPEFDKGDSPTKAGSGDWLRKFQRCVGDEKRIEEAANRQRELVEKLGGKILLLTNVSRFVTGMGREHPIENGFVWHHTLGTPYVPGSSVKGMLRAWLREDGAWDEDEQQFGVWNNDKRRMEDDATIRRQFGSLETGIGKFIVFDMLPTRSPKLVVDVMTPHYSPYYQGTEAPGDWHNPVPISFLTVEAGCSWQVGIAPVTRASPNKSATELEQLSAALVEANQFNGAGAKTAVGYGRFDPDFEAHNAREVAAAAEKAKCEAAETKARAEAEFNADIAANSEQLKHLKRLHRDQLWTASAGNTTMTDTLHKFIDENPSPPQDCLDWIQQWLESIQGYHGVWGNPEDKTGKRKDKPKYKSAIIRDLVKKLNPDLRK